MIGEHAFGVELHPLQVRMLPVPQAHDRAVFEPGGHLETVRQGVALGDQRVVTGGRQRLGQSREHAITFVQDG